MSLSPVPAAVQFADVLKLLKQVIEAIFKWFKVYVVLYFRRNTFVIELHSCLIFNIETS